MPVRLSEAAAQQLLYDLCVKFGFCLGPSQGARIARNPPASVERFASVVYRAEGLDPSLQSDSYKLVRDYVAAAFQRHAENSSAHSV